ncbi:MAG: 16S rRNA (uracil(1498)-N(3))-methyltransferase [Planctomycetota bacterium]|nr:MAG: 16S rRNA (uracil(1498)-N(3))-methyltransferase [Planctomycetota bacterium]
MHRFFVRPEAIGGDEVVLQKQAHQIRDVLRLKAGEHIVVLDDEGFEYETDLTAVSRGEVKGKIVEKREASGEPDVQITLYQSMLAREKFEWVLQKCTEVGVTRFVPVISTRTLMRSCGIKANKLARWRRIIQEAAEQSHRGKLPDLSPPTAFDKAIDDIEGSKRSLIASPEAGGENLRDCLKGYDGSRGVALFVGPEGGFTKEEVQRCAERGAVAFSLGKRILRTETAAVMASGLILYELGELEG